jgi:glycosyltransferase involved in cell wall biosynthesis
MKVCFVSFLAYHLFDPRKKAEFGGAELQLYYLGTELAKDERFTVSFVTGDFQQPDQQAIEGVTLFKLASPTLDVKYLRTLQEYSKLWQLLKKIDADVYVQRAAGMITGLVALFCRANGKKFIYMAAHDNDVIRDKRPSWMPSGTVGALIWKSYRFGLESADTVVVQHWRQQENLRNNYGKKGVIRSSAHRMPDGGSLSEKQGVLWVARCEEWKQPEIFVKLAKAFPSERFIMVCPSAADIVYFEKVRQSAEALSNMQFIDFVPFSEIDEYFLKAKIFVNTSKSEGFPNTFIQAAKTGTPILSYTVDPDGMLEKHQIGRCVQGDYPQLIRLLNALLTDEQAWRKMADNAYAFAKEKHDIKNIVEEDKKTIFSLLQNHQSA